MENGFEGLTSALGIDYKTNTENSLLQIENKINEIEERKNELVNKKNIPLKLLQDQSFLQEELRSLILNARTVMHKLENDIKVGTPARMYEVYAKLLDAIGNQYRVLLDLNKAIFEAKKDDNKININNIGSNKISLTSEQLLDMVDKAKERSEMNKIEVDFKIESEKDERK